MLWCVKYRQVFLQVVLYFDEPARASEKTNSWIIIKYYTKDSNLNSSRSSDRSAFHKLCILTSSVYTEQMHSNMESSGSTRLNVKLIWRLP